MSREFLITKFVCASCGSNLSLSYEKPKGAGGYCNGEPTGADMVQQLVAVVPCKRCLEPLRSIQDALSTLGIASSVRGGA